MPGNYVDSGENVRLWLWEHKWSIMSCLSPKQIYIHLIMPQTYVWKFKSGQILQSLDCWQTKVKRHVRSNCLMLFFTLCRWRRRLHGAVFPAWRALTCRASRLYGGIHAGRSRSSFTCSLRRYGDPAVTPNTGRYSSRAKISKLLHLNLIIFITFKLHEVWLHSTQWPLHISINDSAII